MGVKEKFQEYLTNTQSIIPLLLVIQVLYCKLCFLTLSYVCESYQKTNDKNNIFRLFSTFSHFHLTFLFITIHATFTQFSQFQLFRTDFPVKILLTKRNFPTKISWEVGSCWQRPLCEHRSGTQKSSSH